MNFYSKYFLPKYLNLRMSNKNLEKHRMDVVGKVSGAVLEIGFGSGLNLPYYKNVSKLYALDPVKELYKLAENNIRTASFPIEYIQASAESIPISNNSLDFVISTWSLCSIPHPEVALKEIFRVLKPNGKFSFIEHGKSPQNYICRIQNLLTPFSKRIAGGCHLNRDIEKLIRDAGFEVQKIEKFKEKSKPLSFIYKGVAIAKK
ncbi:MAG: class I SAM-dependent methyltransferase [Candidatus Taylorbacteria bacterium]|nr:class I SAM-dependent methyltransferase [Candidatus Taylorbacteria bacterium]